MPAGSASWSEAPQRRSEGSRNGRVPDCARTGLKKDRSQEGPAVGNAGYRSAGSTTSWFAALNVSSVMSQIDSISSSLFSGMRTTEPVSSNTTT